MVRFLHTADWQLGMTRHFLEGEAQARFTASRIDAVATIGALAVERNCDFVVVGGDVFESNQIERQVIVRALDSMKATPRVDFYLLPGNHDPLDAGSIFVSKAFVENCPPNVRVIVDSDEIAVAPGVAIVGAPWPNKRPLSDLVSASLADLAADGTQRIVVGHGATDNLSPNPDDPALIGLDSLEAFIRDGVAHYVALGDRHSTTPVGATGRIWYSGAPEPTAYDEVDPGNVLIVELDQGDISVESQRVGMWRFVLQSFELAGGEDCDSVAEFLEELPDKQRTIVKLALVGQLSLAAMAGLGASLDHAADLFAALEQWERRSDLVALPDDEDFSGLGLSGFADAALQDLRELGDSGRDGDDDDGAALVARDALGLLYRLAGASS